MVEAGLRRRGLSSGQVKEREEGQCVLGEAAGGLCRRWCCVPQSVCPELSPLSHLLQP